MRFNGNLEKPRGPGRLILKRTKDIGSARTLIIGCPASEAMILIEDTDNNGPETVFLCFEFGQYLEIERMFSSKKLPGVKAVFDFWLGDDESFNLVISYLPKSSRLVEYILALAHTVLKPEHSLLLAGENGAGIRSAKKKVEKTFGPIDFHDIGYHSALFTARKTGNKKFSWQNFITTYEFELAKEKITIKNLPGVFSLDKLDKGTELLLQGLKPEDLSGKILDFGCGSGIIGVALKKLRPENIVDLTDSNSLAIQSSKLTAEANGVMNCKIFPSDIFSEVKEKYDLIISNPPFHHGLKADTQMSEDFIKQCIDYLNPNGKIRLVANSFLKYNVSMEKVFGNVKIISQTPSYSVYESQKIS